MNKEKQAERILISNGYTIHYFHYKGKAYPHAVKDGIDTSDVNLKKLVVKLFPDTKLV